METRDVEREAWVAEPPEGCEEWWRVCRACLSSAAPHSMVSVFHVHISKKLMALAGVQVWPADGLPQRICRECIVKLDVSFQFKKQCERADQRLRQYRQRTLSRVRHEPHFDDHQGSIQPAPLTAVESGEIPLNDAVLTDLSHSIPTSIKNHSDPSTNTLNENLDSAKSERKGYDCKTCYKVFDTSTKLSRHVYIHTGRKPFKCEICEKTFSHNSNLKAHMKLHSDEKPYVCEICRKGCKRSKDLEMHMRTHTGEKPHICNVCGKAFSSSSNLIAHYRTHTGEKPYVCSVCQKAFCQSNELSKHKKVHVKEKHVCQICGKTFNDSSALVLHVMNHDDEKSNVCNICDKSFYTQSALTTHMKVHGNYAEY